LQNMQRVIRLSLTSVAICAWLQHGIYSSMSVPTA